MPRYIDANSASTHLPSSPPPTNTNGVSPASCQHAAARPIVSETGVGSSMQSDREVCARDIDQPLPQNLSVDSFGFTPFARLRAAIELGDVAAAKSAIATVADINAADENGAKPLAIAAELGKVEIVKALREAGARMDVDLDGPSAARALRAAALEGQETQAAAWIAAGADLNVTNKNGATALMIAAQRGHANVVKVLTGAGARVDALNLQGESALTMAAQGGHVEVAKELRGAGATLVQGQEILLSSKLKSAVESGDGNKAAALIVAGAEMSLVFSREIYGSVVNPFLSGSHGTSGVVSTAAAALLRARGPNFSATLSLQMHLDCALAFSATMAKLFLVKALRSAGACVPAACIPDAERALRDAARTGRADALNVWLEAGVDVNADNDDGVTALMFAITSRNENVLRALIDAGADLDLDDKDGETALIYAAKSGNLVGADLLLSHGASTTVPDNLGNQAMQWALFAGHLRVVDRLLGGAAPITQADLMGAALRLTGNVPANTIDLEARFNLAAQRARDAGMQFLATALAPRVVEHTFLLV